MKKIKRLKSKALYVKKTLEEGETLIAKIRRILDENEPITDGAPLIFTPKKDGVKPEYNIRTDRWQIAMDAMDKVNTYKASEYLKRNDRGEMEKTEENPKPTEEPAA